ncbi:MAG TPA: ImmA/IrrE family metallo-endopeptidase [Candidatus Eisenbergiella merdipullorum]|uniref:ImmA/IrrE family metallo-endopeptidase n=1 Tax=Candidatus Eisenbergiella merdipullorum TaxID=2838553 RepID=A0A9D2I5J7_9FIRM|nr:ImmA/IrrE family metallo-endopeptidase [Candidatus Eisenbergiella merdipullorum]
MADSAMIYQSIAEIYKKCRVKSFPINCLKILDVYGIKYKPYSSQKSSVICFSVSNDAFTAKGTIFYNDTLAKRRVAFSLMHEFAHIVMNIPDDSAEQEDEADYFASCILAPRILIHYLLDKKDAPAIHDRFGLSYTAANNALRDYKRWCRDFEINGPSRVELEIYKPFAPALSKKEDEKPIRSDLPDSVKKHIAKLRRERKKIAKEMQAHEKRHQFLSDNLYDGDDFKIAKDMRSYYEELSL